MNQPVESANVVLSYLAHTRYRLFKMSHLLKISKIDISALSRSFAYLSKRGDTAYSKILKHLIELFAVPVLARHIHGKIQRDSYWSLNVDEKWNCDQDSLLFPSKKEKEKKEKEKKEKEKKKKEKKEGNTRRERVSIFRLSIGAIDRRSGDLHRTHSTGAEWPAS